jgi:hypothetical protein
MMKGLCKHIKLSLFTNNGGSNNAESTEHQQADPEDHVAVVTGLRRNAYIVFATSHFPSALASL